MRFMCTNDACLAAGGVWAVPQLFSRAGAFTLVSDLFSAKEQFGLFLDAVSIPF